jgi:hypothetical protein
MARKKQRTTQKYDMGPEPIVIQNRVDLLRAYQWYNYEYTVKQGRKFVTEYVRNNFGKFAAREVAKLNTLKDSDFTTTVCWQARLASKGILPDESMENFKDALAKLLDRGRLSKPKKVVKTAVPKPSVQDRIRAQVSAWIADIEDEIDKLGTKVKSDFSLFDFLKTVEAKPVHINKILDYYRPVRDEVVEALAGKDQQLNEAYSYLSKAALKRLVAFYETLISDAERSVINTRAVRKPRKKKVKSGEQLTKNVKYLSESKEHKVTSVSPEKLVGAAQVWLFNVRYNTLTVYNALDGGLTVKGTTLQNFQPDASISKRIRKPDEALNDVLKSGKVALRKLMNQFNTKATEGTGRINKDTLIVRVL